MLYNMLPLAIMEPSESESEISNYVYESEVELEKFDLDESKVVVLDFPPKPQHETDIPP